MSQIFDAICGGNLEEVKHIVNGDPECVYIQNKYGRTPLDVAIAWGNLEMVQFLFKKGGRPNLDIYHNKKNTTVHRIAQYGDIAILKLVFAKGILPLSVLNVKDCVCDCKIPLDCDIAKGYRKTATLLRRLPVDFVFLAMQCAKRDRQCTLRRLPDELLDMVVDVVAARFHLKVVW